MTTPPFVPTANREVWPVVDAAPAEIAFVLVLDAVFEQSIGDILAVGLPLFTLERLSAGHAGRQAILSWAVRIVRLRYVPSHRENGRA